MPQSHPAPCLGPTGRPCHHTTTTPETCPRLELGYRPRALLQRQAILKKTAIITSARCPRHCAISLPSATVHTPTLPSDDPEKSSDRKRAQQVTPLLWPVRTACMTMSSRCGLNLHRTRVPSYEADTAFCRSKSTQKTDREWRAITRCVKRLRLQLVET